MCYYYNMKCSTCSKSTLLIIILSALQLLAGGRICISSFSSGIYEVKSLQTPFEILEEKTKELQQELEQLPAGWNWWSGYRAAMEKYREAREPKLVKRRVMTMFHVVNALISNPARTISLLDTPENVVKRVQDKYNAQGSCIEVDNFEDVSFEEIKKLSMCTLPILYTDYGKSVVMPLMRRLKQIKDIENEPIPSAEAFASAGIGLFFAVFGCLFWIDKCCYQKDADALFRQIVYLEYGIAQTIVARNFDVQILRIVKAHLEASKKEVEELDDTGMNSDDRKNACDTFHQTRTFFDFRPERSPLSISAVLKFLISFSLANVLLFEMWGDD